MHNCFLPGVGGLAAGDIRQGFMRYRPSLARGECCLLRAARLGTAQLAASRPADRLSAQTLAVSQFNDKRSRLRRFSFVAAPSRGLPEIEIGLGGYRLPRANLRARSKATGCRIKSGMTTNVSLRAWLAIHCLSRTLRACPVRGCCVPA